jgi:hypothetical protein
MSLVSSNAASVAAYLETICCHLLTPPALHARPACCTQSDEARRDALVTRVHDFKGDRPDDHAVGAAANPPRKRVKIGAITMAQVRKIKWTALAEDFVSASC